MTATVLLIPSLEATKELFELVESLKDSFEKIVIIDDGSSRKDSMEIFAQLKELSQVKLIKHGINLGKGAAIRTGLNYALTEVEGLSGVITADSDGQHASADILKLKSFFLENPQHLCLGVRQFSRDIPLRSYLGNMLTIKVFAAVTGVRVTDTQTGLRAIPQHFIPNLLKIESRGYEFEMEMLIESKGIIPIAELPIETIYIDDNAGSHFNPLRDSLKIYFVLLRFVFTSIASAVLDMFLFLLLWKWTHILPVSQYGARAISSLFNFSLNKSVVFKSIEDPRKAVIKYFSLVVFIAVASHLLILLLSQSLELPIMVSKITAEVVLFFVSFFVQREFVFKSSHR